MESPGCGTLKHTYLSLRAEALESRKAAQVKQKRLYDRTRRKAQVFKPGDYVPKKNSDE
jgi:hypothetical protein